MKKLLNITLLGDITLDISGQKGAGFGYDVPFDGLNVPYLPMGRILREELDISDRIRIGLAKPYGYDGIEAAITDLGLTASLYDNFIRNYFTRSFFDKENGFYIRSLKSGQVFCCLIEGDDEELDALLLALEKMDHIGVITGHVTGQVEVEIMPVQEFMPADVELNRHCSYRRLDYLIRLTSPLCSFEPFKDDSRSYSYVPGAYMLKHLGGRWQNVKCSNAYICRKGQRLLPVPACVSLVKLNKEMLHYRLASGKDPKKVEQDVTLTNAYTDNIDSRFVDYCMPDTERFLAMNGKIYDVLSSGQIFAGSIYGSDREIREIYDYLQNRCLLRMGYKTEDGLGEALVRITGLGEEEIPYEDPASCFDLRCLSNTMILNDEGMSDLRPEALLKEIEYVLDAKGQLEIVEKYSNECNDYMADPESGCYRNATRMFAEGTVLRIRTKDGSPRDIYKLKHCFIGERNSEGYGEVAAYPARDTYYRVAVKSPVDRRGFDMECSRQDRTMGINVASKITEDVLEKFVKNVSILDRVDENIDSLKDEDIPMDILTSLRDFYAPLVPDDRLKAWYREGKKEENHV